MSQAFYAALRLIIIGLALVDCLSGIARADEAAFPRHAEELTPPKLRSHLSPERIDVLVGRWIAQIDPADVEGATGAIDLLGDAPKAFVNAARLRLRKSGMLE